MSGDSKPSDCGKANKATYSTELSGSLTGCWSTFVSHFNCQEMNGFALYTEIGREEFAGTLDGHDIKFDTQYTFDGLFPSSDLTQAQRCISLSAMKCDFPRRQCVAGTDRSGPARIQVAVSDGHQARQKNKAIPAGTFRPHLAPLESRSSDS